VTGLPIPRFVSLKSAKVNLRRGPDTRYPIDRVLRRRALPVRVVDEYESWREVEVPADPLVTGTRRGWIHGALLESRDRVMIRDGVTTLRESPIREARPRARAEPGVIAELESCREGWCRIAILGETYEGWVPRHRLWGVAFAPGL